MVSKSAVNAACIALLPIFILISGYFLFTEQFLYSLIALGGVVVCVRLRLWMGYRGARGSLFITHLILSISLIALLLLLITSSLPHVMLPMAYVLFVGMAITGAMLVQRSWRHPNTV